MNSQARTILIVLGVLLVGALGYSFLTRPDDRNVVQKVGDAIEREDTRELQDRTPGERIEDAAKDVKEDIKN